MDLTRGSVVFQPRGCLLGVQKAGWGRNKIVPPAKMMGILLGRTQTRLPSSNFAMPSEIGAYEHVIYLACS